MRDSCHKQTRKVQAWCVAFLLGIRYLCSRWPSRSPATSTQKIPPWHAIFKFFCSVITWQLFIIVLVFVCPSSLAFEKSQLLFLVLLAIAESTLIRKKERKEEKRKEGREKHFSCDLIWKRIAEHLNFLFLFFKKEKQVEPQGMSGPYMAGSYCLLIILFSLILKRRPCDLRQGNTNL